MTEKEYKALHRKQMYDQIQRLRNEEHLSIQRIADKLGVNFRTVKRYLEMSRSEFESFSDNITNKPQILEPYTDFVVERLSLYQDTSTAQMHDWLKEAYPDFPKVTQRTVYSFVMKVRQDYNLPRIAMNERQYNPMPETPPGKYAQVDFGHKKLRCGSGQWIMVHFMAMLLCHSRYKYIWFQEKPFTSETAAIAHERAFAFFQGVPKYIIYDQDAVFLYDENLGDYKMTTVFESYVKSRPFTPIFWRPADPESKGKVENCVKYVKQNFLQNRQYSRLEVLQEEGEAWLNRTGNMIEHGTTCQVPYEVWCKECKDLQPYTPVTELEANPGHKVLKTNSVRYKGNTYTVPTGTYKNDDTRVYVTEDNGDVLISDVDGVLIARHRIPAGRGQIVVNKNHLRDRSSSIKEQCDHMATLFTDQNAISLFLSMLRARYPRYMREQLASMSGCILKYGQVAADAALEKCVKNKLYSANNFEAFISMGKVPEPTEKAVIKPLGDARTKLIVNFDPNRSSIVAYENLFKGSSYGTE